MAEKLSKADQIRKLLHLPNGVIAERADCPESYVRTVRQRTSSDGNPVWSNGDRAWYPRYLQSKRDRYANDPEYRERLKAHQTSYRRKRYHSDPEFRARAIARVQAHRARRRAEARA